MNSFLKYEWRPHDGGTQVGVTFNGNLMDITKAVGMLIQQLYGNLRDEDKEFFRFMCKQMMDDDCPIWHPEQEKVTTIDLKELRKQMREEAEQNG